MTAFVACRGHRPLLLSVLGMSGRRIRRGRLPGTALAAEPVPESTVARAGHGSSRSGQLLKLPERTATLVIGNPLIADAAVQPGGVVVITAKSYGMTNLVALDRAGATLSRIPDPGDRPERRTVVIYRGIEREIL